MSQPNHKHDSDPAPRREARGLPPITSIPAAAIAERVDPTEEIRNLVEQLQATAKDASERLAVVERERDEFEAELGEARATMHNATRREEETRARFVEVTSVIRERDELLESLDQHQKSIAELQRQLDALKKQEIDVQRQRGAVMIERDSAARERDNASRERDEVRAKLAEAQKQTSTLRQARDASQRQCHDLTDKVQHLTDQLAEISHERDDARAQAKGGGELQRRCDELQAERDQHAQHVEEATREIESLRSQLVEATRDGGGHAAALAQAREEAMKLATERDAARARAQERVHELDELRETLRQARSETATGDLGSAERDSLNERILALETERAGFIARIAERERQAAEFEPDLAAAQRTRDEARTSLAAAQKQIERIIRERDEQRQQSIEHTIELENQLAAAQQKLAGQPAAIAAADKRAAAAEREMRKAIEKADNFDKERLAAIDVAAQLDAARREIRKLTADLAEARLEAKSGGSRHARAKTPTPTPAPAPVPTQPAAPSAPAKAASEADEESLDEKEARGLLAEMKRCHTSFTKTPTDFSLLNELHCQVAHFAERARVSGYLALHRLGHAFATLAQGLYRYPEQVNPSTLRTIGQTLDLLGVLLKQKNYAKLKDPNKAAVYAVDDDSENCDAIRMALETVFMRTHCAQEPAVALAELGSDKFDLIFLDVALPHMDGFELCQHIRDLPNHVHTPIVFLTGLTTIENRVQSSLSGGNDFIGKPFNLHELGVKAVSLVLKASLHLE